MKFNLKLEAVKIQNSGTSLIKCNFGIFYFNDQKTLKGDIYKMNAWGTAET